MNASNALYRLAATDLPQATHPAPAAANAPRYRARDVGVGYGRSSGYAQVLSFLPARNEQGLRIR